MKKLLFAAAVLSSLVFVACSKDDDKEPQQEPEITLDGYEEPYMKWGATKAEIKRAVPYELLSETDGTLSFSGERKVSGYIYMTSSDNVSDSLVSSIALVSTSYAGELSDFLFSKYVPVTADQENYRFYCVNKEKTLAVVLEIYSSKLLTVMYFPVYFSESAASIRVLGTRAADSAETESMQKIYGRLLNKVVF